MIEQLFEVATEFRFDVGQAIIGTQNLQTAVDDLSKSAGSALTNLNYLASGLVAHLGFGAGGLLGVLQKSISMSEEFNQQSLMFANTISSNMKTLTQSINGGPVTAIGSFNDRLMEGSTIMRNISDAAIKMGLPTNELASITQRLAAPLAVHGKLGNNFEGGIGMAKNLMLASEATGLHPQVATESLARALTDKMALHGALFARLVNTQAFKQAHIMTQPQLINMNVSKKIDLLTKALEQLGGEAGFIANRLNQLGVQFTIMKDQLINVLKPIGDALIKPIRMLLQRANAFLLAHGKQLGDNIGKLISNIFEDPSKLFVNLMQLRSFGSDFKKAMHLTELFQIFMFLKFILGKLGITLNGGLLMKGFKFLITSLRALAGWLFDLGIIGKVFTFLRAALLEVLPLFAGFLFFFQVISRARAIAHLTDMKNLIEMTPKFTALFVRIKSALEAIFLPITILMDFFAELIAPIFMASTWLKILLPLMEGLADFLEVLAQVVLFLMSGLSGLTSALIGFAMDLMNLQNPFKNMVENFKEGFSSFMSGHPLKTGDTPATKTVVYNSNHIEARFDMREQMEPDRVAFAVTQHLKKLALNPTQGRGNSLAAAFSGNQPIAGDR